MEPKPDTARYQSFLLRVQWVDDFEQRILRLSLENVATRQRYAFTKMDDLCRFLHDQLKPISNDDSIED